MNIERFPNGAHRRVGRPLRHGWFPSEDIIVPDSFQVRMPTRAYPYSYLRHFYTIKYAGLVLKYKPKLYAQLHGMNDFRVHVLKALKEKL